MRENCLEKKNTVRKLFKEPSVDDVGKEHQYISIKYEDSADQECFYCNGLYKNDPI